MLARLGRLAALCLLLTAVSGSRLPPGGHHLQVNGTSLDQIKNENTNGTSKINIGLVAPLQSPGTTLPLGQLISQAGATIGIDSRAQFDSERLASGKAKRINRMEKIIKKKRSKKTRKSSRSSARRMRKLKISRTVLPIVSPQRQLSTGDQYLLKGSYAPVQRSISTQPFISGNDLPIPNYIPTSNIASITNKGQLLNQSLPISVMPPIPNITGDLIPQPLKEPKTYESLKISNVSNNINHTLPKSPNLKTNENKTNLETPSIGIPNSTLNTIPQVEVLANNTINTTEPILKAIKSRFFIIKEPPKNKSVEISKPPAASNKILLINQSSRISSRRRSSSRSSLNKTRHETIETIIHEYEHPEVTTSRPIRREGGPRFFLIREPPKNSTEKPPPKPMPKLVTRRIISKKSHTISIANSTNSSSSENSSNMSQLVLSGSAADAAVTNLIPPLMPFANNSQPSIHLGLTTMPTNNSVPNQNGSNATYSASQLLNGSNITLPSNNVLTNSNILNSDLAAQGIRSYGVKKSNKVRKSSRRKRKKTKKTMKRTSTKINRQVKQLLNTSMLSTLQNNTIKN